MLLGVNQANILVHIHAKGKIAGQIQGATPVSLTVATQFVVQGGLVGGLEHFYFPIYWE